MTKIYSIMCAFNFERESRDYFVTHILSVELIIANLFYAIVHFEQRKKNEKQLKMCRLLLTGPVEIVIPMQQKTTKKKGRITHFRRVRERIVIKTHFIVSVCSFTL